MKAEGENKAGTEGCPSRDRPTGLTATRMELAMLSLLRRAGRRGLRWWVASLCPAKALLGGSRPLDTEVLSRRPSSLWGPLGASEESSFPAQAAAPGPSRPGRLLLIERSL